jgi:hypothetical protein
MHSGNSHLFPNQNEQVRSHTFHTRGMAEAQSTAQLHRQLQLVPSLAQAIPTSKGAIANLTADPGMTRPFDVALAPAARQLPPIQACNVRHGKTARTKNWSMTSLPSQKRGRLDGVFSHSHVFGDLVMEISAVVTSLRLEQTLK